jgi:hypothetical protein
VSKGRKTIEDIQIADAKVLSSLNAYLSRLTRGS